MRHASAARKGRLVEKSCNMVIEMLPAVRSVLEMRRRGDER